MFYNCQSINSYKYTEHLLKTEVIETSMFDRCNLKFLQTCAKLFARLFDKLFFISTTNYRFQKNRYENVPIFLNVFHN